MFNPGREVFRTKGPMQRVIKRLGSWRQHDAWL
jgi:hypothetical protein